jgi:hypothetical protein
MSPRALAAAPLIAAISAPSKEEVQSGLATLTWASPSEPFHVPLGKKQALLRQYGTMKQATWRRAAPSFTTLSAGPIGFMQAGQIGSGAGSGTKRASGFRVGSGHVTCSTHPSTRYTKSRAAMRC